MASYTALRAGLATRLATISGITAYAVAPDKPNVPAAVVHPGNPLIRFDEALARGSDGFTFEIRVLVSDVNDVLGQRKLDAYLDGEGTGKVKGAIEGDPTLGGIADFTVVPEVSNYGTYEYGGTQYLGVAFRVEVAA